MLRVAKGIMDGASREKGWQFFESYQYNWGFYYFNIGRIMLDPFPRLAFDKSMGRAASRLINRTSLTDELIPIRGGYPDIFCKTAAGSTTGGGIEFHQDAPAFHMDRHGSIMFWIALDYVSAEQGSMRFLDGSHREGPLGSHRPVFPLTQYPKLVEKYRLSEPMNYHPGDCTVHHGYTFHASPENRTPRPRWACVIPYIASDVQFDYREYAEAENPYGPREKNPIVFP
jgi:hypothetical protein